MKKSAASLTATLACTALLAGCAQSNSNTSSSRTTTAGKSASTEATSDFTSGSSTAGAEEAQKITATTLNVFAAASTRVLNDELQALPEAADTELVFNNDGSPSLVQQIGDGAPADVLITADENNMQKAIDAGSVEAPETLATNSLVLVVSKDNPQNIKSWDDFVKAKDSATVVTCDTKVPCGSVADSVLKENRVEVTPASLESSVSKVLAKVSSGEADAGFVYTTDAKAASDSVTAIEIPNAQKHRNKVMAAVVKSSENQEGAKQFIALLKSAKAADIWKNHDFEPAN
ncbi:MAG: molybdate ABC transporter substrate-binding protein [Corynebacterium sp.]|nr:molybdate ABC transporter substrate-binding protein [Corynebacterium sp.]